MSKSRLISFGRIAENRKARYNFEIKEKIQAGIILTGTEVKSLRLGKASINESYASDTNGKLFLINSSLIFLINTFGKQINLNSAFKLFVIMSSSGNLSKNFSLSTMHLFTIICDK